ncbi:amidohydrolase/deacetylase family metallohydrolase [Paenibacillus wulumuqiensis]|uniref:amidohydrolase/deacetylase family metallohydrolase n=1 Tax=Paenibacillus wulumuqiensis TaxID=1567107 RepID=UPI0006194A83|nr:amidohydrolase/deacetylase family metallohydrolase [Paenibacillus wulumuqiensis]
MQHNTDVPHGLLLRKAMLLSGEQVDVLITEGIISSIRPSRVMQQESVQSGTQQIDCDGWYVTSGWIDMHVHAYSELSPYGDEIDEIGIRHGVTTIVDAGSCGGDDIHQLVQQSIDTRTSLLAFLNISRIGLHRVDELSNLEWIDAARVQKAVQQYPGHIVGLKARISASVVQNLGIEPLRRARQLSAQMNLPLMVHIGSGPPDIREVLSLLESGDIVTHYLNGKSNNLFDEHGQPLPELIAALQRGIHLDVGHGSASFSFAVAEQARDAGIPLHTISTDIYRRNRLDGPVYNMSNVLSKFLYLGYELTDIMEAVTTHAAQWLNRPELAGMQAGEQADLTLFAIEPGPIILTDSEGEQRTADRHIEAKGVVKDGTFFTCQVRTQAGH